MGKTVKQKLEEQGYRFTGENSAIKICEWCREAIRGNNFCYKQKFYGIESNRCIQMTPNVFKCTENCDFCWRTVDYKKNINIKWDKPKQIFENSIKEQKELLIGFYGSKKLNNKKKLEKAMEPNQFAISLTGEPAMYPYLPKFIDIIKKNNMTAFLVSNGTIPKMIKKLTNHQPTNMYITLAANNEKMYNNVCNPVINNGWEKLNKSLRLLKEFNTSVLRLTLIKSLNMKNPKKYAKIIDKTKPTYIEAKAFMAIGGARERLGVQYMPTHKNSKEFAKKIQKHSSYKIKQEKQDSRVVLLGR